MNYIITNDFDGSIELEVNNTEEIISGLIKQNLYDYPGFSPAHVHYHTPIDYDQLNKEGHTSVTLFISSEQMPQEGTMPYEYKIWQKNKYNEYWQVETEEEKNTEEEENIETLKEKIKALENMVEQLTNEATKKRGKNGN
jgi:hypothetical protein